jgi:hypothetical protein
MRKWNNFLGGVPIANISVLKSATVHADSQAGLSAGAPSLWQILSAFESMGTVFPDLLRLSKDCSSR